LQQSGTLENPFAAGIFQSLNDLKIHARFLIPAGLVLAALYFTSLYNFLLFHVLIETFSVIVAFAIFMFAWNTRDKIHNGSLILLGASYLAVGAVELLHAVSYKGMGVFNTNGADTATQLWIAARYIESVSLAAVPIFATRKLSMPKALFVYGLVFMLVVATVFVWPVFPTCYVAGTGLTPFKKVSEYIISAILLVGLAGLIRRKSHFDSRVFRLLGASVVLTIAAELMFTFYISVYGISNSAGHFLKLASFWLIYKAILETGLQRPYTLLFRELARSERRYRDLVDGLPIGVCRIDPDFRLTYINPAGRKMIGYEEEDIRQGIDLDMILYPEDREKKQRRLGELFNGHSIGSTQYRLQRKDGSQADVIVNSRPVYSDDRLKAIQTTLTDVTELYQLQRRLQQSQKMEAIASLAGGMAHEINNLLMGVVGRIELMRLDAAKHDMHSSGFDEVLVGCERIAELIRQLLAYSRGGRYQSKPIPMAEFIQTVLAENRNRFNPKIRLAYTAAADLPTISADPIQLEMVVSAIVNNAVEAVDDSGRIEIDLQARDIDQDQSGRRPGMQPGRYLRLSVEDNGKGMDAATLQHIFEPFYTSKFTGRGLGMASVYGIVKNHGGWIGVDSVQGRGTTVRIYWPVSTPS
jgi:PAS domain S-box-containing protein